VVYTSIIRRLFVNYWLPYCVIGTSVCNYYLLLRNVPFIAGIIFNQVTNLAKFTYKSPECIIIGTIHLKRRAVSDIQTFDIFTPRQINTNNTYLVLGYGLQVDFQVHICIVNMMTLLY